MELVKEIYKTKEITVANFGRCKNTEEMIALAEKLAQAAIESNGTLLVLVDYQGVYLSSEFMERSKELGKNADRFVKKSAMIGSSKVKNILVKIYNVLTRSQLRVFNSKTEALDYLAS